MSAQESKSRFTFFLPDARVLSETEIAEMPTEKKQAAQSDQKEGVWLEIYCPDASCVGEDGKITIPAAGTEFAAGKGIWLNLFCPEGSCTLEEMTDLP